jgi:hypothetical protein
MNLIVEVILDALASAVTQGAAVLSSGTKNPSINRWRFDKNWTRVAAERHFFLPQAGFLVHRNT